MLFIHKATQRPEYGTIDLSTWTLGASDEFAEKAKTYILRGVQQVFELLTKGGIDVSLNIDGKIGIGLPLDSGDDLRPTWDFTLQDFVASLCSHGGRLDYGDEPVDALISDMRKALDFLETKRRS